MQFNMLHHCTYTEHKTRTLGEVANAAAAEQQKEIHAKNSETYLNALIDTPIVGMMVVYFVLPTESLRKATNLVLKPIPFIIVAVQWVLLVTVGNYSLKNNKKSGGVWYLSTASSEDAEPRAMMSAISALILISTVKRTVNILETVSDPEAKVVKSKADQKDPLPTMMKAL
jgi:hypothetical protein